MISDKPGNISFGKKIMNVTAKQYVFTMQIVESQSEVQGSIFTK
jgi:hypothetical protein